jgi:hypothetical protein
MINWLTTNWLMVAVILYAVASEAIGMLPIQSNSVVQLVLRVLGRVSGRV